MWVRRRACAGATTACAEHAPLHTKSTCLSTLQKRCARITKRMLVHYATRTAAPGVGGAAGCRLSAGWVGGLEAT
eukprot:5439506-Pyramimonas_sp.AAC.1